MEIIVYTVNSYKIKPNVFAGFNLAGAWSNPLDIAPNYVGTIMGISGLFCYLTGAIVPNTLSIASAYLTDTQDVWTFLFLLVAMVTIISNMLFMLLGTAELQEWNCVGSYDSRERLHSCGQKQREGRVLLSNNI